MKWYVKAAIHNVLSIVPFGRRVNRVLQERCGHLRRPRMRLDDLREAYLAPISAKYGSVAGLEILEIGTGWLPVLPITLALWGARCRTFDVRRLLDQNSVRRAFELVIEERSLLPDTPTVKRIADIPFGHGGYQEILNSIGIVYTAPIDTTRLPVADDSQDVTVSRLVLQHIPPPVLKRVLAEQIRVLKPGGISIHRVNLHDEYAAVDPGVTLINFLKYPAWFWDHFGNNAMKYVNRARIPFYLDCFRKCGFRIGQLSTRIDQRSYEALRDFPMQAEFRNCSNEELATIGFTVVLQKP